jgi:hypothetical protein
MLQPAPMSFAKGSAHPVLATADAVALRRKHAIQDVVPAQAGTHNHLRLLEQKALATVPKSKAAAYGSPLPCAIAH